MVIGISGKIGSGKDLVAKIIQALTCQPSSLDRLNNPDLGNIDIERFIESKIWDIPKFTVHRFADALKDNVCNIIGCTRAQLEDRDFKETPLPEEWWCYNIGGNLLSRGYYDNEADHKMAEERYLVKTTPRMILQRLGTEGGRMLIHPNIWVNALFSGYQTRPVTLPDETTFIKDEEKWFEDRTSHWIIPDVRFPNELEAIQKREGITIRIERPGYEATGNHLSETSLDDALFDYTIQNDSSIEDLVHTVRLILNKEKIL
jgi:hypothetical protein